MLRSALCALALAAATLGPGARAALAQHDEHDAMNAAMSAPALPAPLAANAERHRLLTPARAATPADRARADSLVRTLRAALAPYRDVRRAEADGYRPFFPNVPQPVYHFTSWRRAVVASVGFDAARPTSLLYRRTPDGGWELVGAMYTAPGRASLAELDARVPLGVARWHRHVNWCLPPLGARERWRERRDGAPVFGPLSPIATEEACRAVGGRFRPALFGWMVHVDPWAADPAAAWADHHH